jgi:diadenosine tetraphosphatase ApaH/serine/threonine PP2A family protein phosphatase
MVGGFQVVHGSPFDEDEYVLAAEEAGQAFGYLERRVAFFGHTHVQGGFIWNRSRVETIQCDTGIDGRQLMEIDPECAYLLNPGSVGQPRDGSPRAAFALYDPEARLVTYCRTEYDVVRAQKKIREAGLPIILADRLALGR